MRNEMIKQVANGVSNPLYKTNLIATEQLMELFDKINRKPLSTANDYIQMYNDFFYTYTNWKALVESKKEQPYPITEQELKDGLEKFVWQLPCGWYVQCV